MFSDLTPVWVGVGLGVPLLLIAVVLTVVVIHCMKKYYLLYTVNVLFPEMNLMFLCDFSAFVQNESNLPSCVFSVLMLKQEEKSINK